MAITVVESSGDKQHFPDHSETRNVQGYVHASGALFVLAEIRDDSNFVVNYAVDLVYAPGGWVDAMGDFLGGLEGDVLPKII